MNRNGSAAHASVCCRALTSSDILATCKIMDELKVSFAGLTGRAMHEAVCRDAVTNKGITLLVAVVQEYVVGFAAAVIDADTYWKKFIWRHPFLSVNAVLKAIMKLKMSSGESGWAASSSTTARILYIAVEKHFRNRGVGTCLYRSLFDVLNQQGVGLVEAHIDVENVAAIQLYTGVGGQVETREDFLLGSLNLAVSRDLGGHR